ncbi:hypothetical protein OS493_011870 [Desmophyllum pertusum]|uniref:Uncharacterized protein n=1 Tax=Desmophyllum pertusum TaxID=174260 RepID=A0A9X0CFW2_9CNID|nr:hypothetical protein OS493_011870 [Desmophyllum pertusum]
MAFITIVIDTGRKCVQSNKWLTPADQWTAADFSFSLGPRLLNRSGLQSRSLLLADHNVLSSFLSLIRNSTAEFQRFPNGTAVAQCLKNLESELRIMITVLRRLERIFSFGTQTNATASMGSMTSGSRDTAVLPMRSSQITSQNSNRASNSTEPTIHSVALRVWLILGDLYSSLLEMDDDFNKMRKTRCF